MTTPFVVDSSVVAKWFFDEEHQDIAELLRGPGFELLAPDFLLVELGSVSLQKTRRGQVARKTADAVVSGVDGLPIELFPSGALLPEALGLALAHHPSIYDCLYAALAVREQCQLITADRRLYSALQPPFPETLLWIEDLQPPA